MSNQQPSKSGWPSRPPYPALPTTTSSYPISGPTSNPSSISSETSNVGGAPHFQPSSYSPPVPSPTVSQNPNFSLFQPIGDLSGNTTAQQEQEQLARLEAHLQAMQHRQQQSGPDPASWHGYMPQPHDMGAVETRKEAAHRYVRENALVSEAATRLMIREMEDVGL
jgi:hypothetical protein